jgi:hypothetical protein
MACVDTLPDSGSPHCRRSSVPAREDNATDHDWLIYDIYSDREIHTV